MAARRAGKLVLTAPVLLILTPLAIVGGPRGVFAALAVGTYWLISAYADYSKQLTITDDQLRMTGYIGGAIIVRRAEAVSCDYIKYRNRERGAELFFLEVRDNHGQRLKVWRYGWGRNRRSVYDGMHRWLGDSPAVVSPEARQILEGLSR